MLLFSQRIRLRLEYQRWLDDQTEKLIDQGVLKAYEHISDTPETLIGWLQHMEYLNEERINADHGKDN